MNKINKKIIYEVVFAILAVVAVTLAVLDLSNQITIIQGSLVYYLDLFIILIFAVDYFTRLYLAENRKTFVKRNIADLIAIIPFNSLFKAFRLVRLTKVLRLTKMMKVTKFSRVFAYATRLYARLKKFFETNGLIYVIYFSVFMILISTLAISYVENMSFTDALWWSFVTATTVGYGDISPSTALGRIIAVILMMVGIGTIGMITGTIATYFLSKTKSSGNNDDDVIKAINESITYEDSEKEEIINYMNYIVSKRK